MEQIRIIDEAHMTPEIDAAIRDGLCACFPADVATFSRTRAWHGSGPAYTVLIGEERCVVAHLGAVQRLIGVGQESLSIAGVQNVFVRPEHRGRGVVDRLLVAAMEEAKRRSIGAGLLFCLPKLEGIYARNGWRVIPWRKIWARRASGERYVLDEKNIAMFYPLRRESFPEGEIDLRGDDW